MSPAGHLALRNLAPMLAVESGERTVDFYCNRLGFQLLNSVQFQGRIGWCLIGAGGPSGGPDDPYRVEIMFSATGVKCGSDRDTRRGVILYFYPEDVVGLQAQYKAKELKVSDLRVTVYQMKEFDIEDPDGYQLWFGQHTKEPPTVRE